MKLRKNFLGPNAVMFGDSSCPACLSQVKILMDKFGKNYHITYYDLSRFEPPSFILDRDGSYSMPTWVLPDGTIHRGVINKNLDRLVKSNNKKSSFGKNCVAGDGTVPQIDSLVQCGKNFPGGGGMNIPNSFMNTIQNKWGSSDYLNAGIGGYRSIGPGSSTNDIYYSNNNLNDIRMYPPGGQLETSFSLNRTCNTMRNNPGENTYGLVYNSKNPQIVGFGRRGRKGSQRFGELYSQMGGAYLNERIVTDRFGGATQLEIPRPRSVPNKNIYVGQVQDYNPINKFGKKKKPGEGSVISLTRKNKIKIR
jgi:hypothetical protein